MKSKGLDKISPSLRVLLIYLLIWIFPIAIFWSFKGGINPMLYYIVFLYGWYPISACVMSYKIGKCDCLGKLKRLSPVFIGVMNGLVWCLTYGVANTLVSGNLNPPEMADILFHIAFAVIGFVIGDVVYYYRKKSNC